MELSKVESVSVVPVREEQGEINVLAERPARPGESGLCQRDEG